MGKQSREWVFRTKIAVVLVTPNTIVTARRLEVILKVIQMNKMACFGERPKPVPVSQAKVHLALTHLPIPHVISSPTSHSIAGPVLKKYFKPYKE